MEKKETKNKPETTHTHTHTDDPTREVKGKAKKNRAQGLFANRCLYKRFIGSKNETGNPLPPPTSIPEIEEEEEEEEEKKNTETTSEPIESRDRWHNTSLSCFSPFYSPFLSWHSFFFFLSSILSSFPICARARVSVSVCGHLCTRVVPSSNLEKKEALFFLSLSPFSLFLTLLPLDFLSFSVLSDLLPLRQQQQREVDEMKETKK